MTETFTDYAKQAMHHLMATHRWRTLWPFLLLVPVMITLVACHDQNNSPPSARPVKYVIAQASNSGNQYVQTGEIRSHDEVVLSFRVGGRLLSRSVDVGDRVKAGQILAIQESETSQNQLNSARADLDSARAAERVAAINLNRMRILMPKGAISRAQFDTAQSDWQAALSRRQSSEASLKNARESLAWTHLIAPDDGIITSVNASAGQVLGTGETVLTLAVSNVRDAVFNVPTPQLIAKLGATPVAVSLHSDPTVQASGRLRDISPQADPQTRTWRVRLTLSNPPDALSLGASVQGIWKQSDQEMIVLPASALTRSAGKPAVFVVDKKQQRLQLREVELTKFTTANIFVTSGIHTGDAVVTAGVSKLRQGEKVVFKEQDK